MREHCATVTMAGNSRTEDKPMKHQRMQSGFTLIELMIVVAIIGIVSGLAYPAFKEQLAKSRRADAKATLVGAQQWMERLYTENFRYDRNSAGVEVTDASQFPSRFSVAPKPPAESPLYEIAVEVEDRDKNCVKDARRAGPGMANAWCRVFSIDH